MGRDRFSFTSFLHHKQLGQNGHRFQIDGESPQDLHQAELMVEHKGQQDSRPKQKFDPAKLSTLYTEKPHSSKDLITVPECVMVVVICGLKLHVHQVYGAERRAQEEDLHCRVVHRDEAGEQVQVASCKYTSEEDL
jgi:hypothetical protein